MQARNVRVQRLKLAIMLLGDGWSEKDRIGYTSKDAVLLQYFGNLTKTLVGKYPKITLGDRAFKAVIYSTSLVKDLLRLSPTFRTKKNFQMVHSRQQNYQMRYLIFLKNK